MPDFPIDFSSIRRSARPNQCLALPPGIASTGEAEIVSPVFAVDADRLRNAFERMVAGEPRVREVERTPDGRQIHLVQRSRWLRFADDVWVAFMDQGGNRSSVAIWSRSRLGYYDLGVNRARVERWLRQLEKVAGDA